MSVIVYSTPNCMQCNATIKSLIERNIEYSKVDLTKDTGALEKVRSLGYMSAPVVVVDEVEHWSGFRPDKISELSVVQPMALTA